MTSFKLVLQWSFHPIASWCAKPMCTCEGSMRAAFTPAYLWPRLQYMAGWRLHRAGYFASFKPVYVWKVRAYVVCCLGHLCFAMRVLGCKDVAKGTQLDNLSCYHETRSHALPAQMARAGMATLKFQKGVLWCLAFQVCSCSVHPTTSVQLVGWSHSFSDLLGCFTMLLILQYSRMILWGASHCTRFPWENQSSTFFFRTQKRTHFIGVVWKKMVQVFVYQRVLQAVYVPDSPLCIYPAN